MISPAPKTLVFPMRILTFTALFFLCCSACQPAYAQDDDFFSPERFSLRIGEIDRISGNGNLQRSIRKFIEAFTRGKEELSEGNFTAAEPDLHFARDVWPEFYGTDFLLALLYERTGNIDAAARYYKSYLIKLKAFESGSYGMSESIIRSILPYRPEKYETAFALVDARLSQEGISIKRVRPMGGNPAFIYSLAAALFIIAFCVVVCRRVWHFAGKWYKINHPPAGFWVCRHCLTENPDPNKVCQECGRPRELR